MKNQNSNERILTQGIHTKTIPKEVQDSFKEILKQGIYKELYHRNLLTDAQLNSLINR